MKNLQTVLCKVPKINLPIRNYLCSVSISQNIPLIYSHLKVLYLSGKNVSFMENFSLQCAMK